MRLSRLTAVLLVMSAISLLLCGRLESRRNVPSPRELLRSVGRFSESEWSAVERGDSVARLIETDSREIAVVGAVRIRGSGDALIARTRDVANLKRSPIVLDAQRLSMPPIRAELTRLPLEEHSLNLQNCHVGNCPVRVSAEDVRRFERDVNWRGVDWRAQSAAVWADVLASRLAAYVRDGRKAMPDYVNRPEPLNAASELALLLREYRFVAAYAPELDAYLQELGPHPPAGSEQMLYWTKEDFGVRPILRISHQILYRVSRPAPVVIIATNQVYADHYLDAAFGLILILDAAEPEGGKEFYMVVVNRARTRSLSGFLRHFVRATVQNRSREALRRILTSTKSSLEGRL